MLNFNNKQNESQIHILKLLSKERKKFQICSHLPPQKNLKVHFLFNEKCVKCETDINFFQ